MKNKITPLGFEFGSLGVTRTCSDRNGAAIVSIKTDKAQFSIRASKTGLVRFYDNLGNECELVSKSYIELLEARYE